MSDYQFKDLLDLGNGMAYYCETINSVKTEYYCVPRSPELLISDRGRRILRMETDTDTNNLIQGKSVKLAGGTPDFVFYATDISYVKALTYI